VQQETDESVDVVPKDTTLSPQAFTDSAAAMNVSNESTDSTALPEDEVTLRANETSEAATAESTIKPFVASSPMPSLEGLDYKQSKRQQQSCA